MKPLDPLPMRSPRVCSWSEWTRLSRWHPQKSFLHFEALIPEPRELVAALRLSDSAGNRPELPRRDVDAARLLWRSQSLNPGLPRLFPFSGQTDRWPNGDNIL